MSRWVNIAGEPVRLDTGGSSAPPLPSLWSGKVVVTAGGTSNTKGAWAELVASTTDPATLIHLRVATGAKGNFDSSCLMDLAIGPAGSESIVVANLAFGFHDLSAMGLLLPLSIPSGSRLSVRSQSATASRQATCSASIMDGFAGAPDSIDTFGADTAASRGTNLSGDNVYVELSSSTPRAYRGVIICPTGVLSSWANETTAITVGAGGAGAETDLGSINVQTTSNEAFTFAHGDWFPYVKASIPAGSRLAVKQSVGRNYRDAVIYGVPA